GIWAQERWSCTPSIGRVSTTPDRDNGEKKTPPKAASYWDRRKRTRYGQCPGNLEKFRKNKSGGTVGGVGVPPIRAGLERDLHRQLDALTAQSRRVSIQRHPFPLRRRRLAN